jgi:tetratricopeptide (TPR) repeat protein
MHFSAALLVFCTGAEIALAQDPPPSDRAIKAMPAAYSDPLCELKGTHWKTTAGTTNLKSALEATDPAKRAKELDKGKAILLEGIEKNKQDKSSTAWFNLARVYLYQGDLGGADSALARAQAISPKCAGMIEGLRYTVWLPLINAGADFAKAGTNDSALALLRQAATIYPERPQAALGAGAILANSGKSDSAIPYFQKAAEVAERENLTAERDQATFNLAAVLQQANRHQEAITALEKYPKWKPDDADAKRALAVSYQLTGQTAKAQALNAEVVAKGGGSTHSSSESAAAGGGVNPAGAVAANDAMRLAIGYYSAKNWAEAAKAFEKAVALAPYSRDATYGLASSYLALNDGPKLVSAAQKLMAIEPMNADALALLGNGYRTTHQNNEALEVAKQLFALPANVSVDKFTLAADSATLSGVATGRAAQTAEGKPIPPLATALIFEFVSAQGNVLATEGVEIPALKKDETSNFAVRATGKGIVGWRYKRK